MIGQGAAKNKSGASYIEPSWRKRMYAESKGIAKTNPSKTKLGKANSYKDQQEQSDNISDALISTIIQFIRLE
jgi:hypothetical protein